MTPSLLVVTPWYPTAERPYYGSFVRGWVRALVAAGQAPTVLHLDYVEDAPARVVTDSIDDGVPLVHVVVPVAGRATPEKIWQGYTNALKPLLAERWADVRTIHAHVMFPLAWALTTVVAPGTRIVVTEHSSKLDYYFGKADYRRRYAEALAASASCLTVSTGVAATIQANMPAYLSERVQTLGNPIDFDRFPLKVREENLLRRWLYLGNLVEGKGLPELLAGFARARSTDRREDAVPLQLSIVGNGPLRDDLVGRAEQLGISDDVQFLGGVAAAEVPKVLADHDLLVHLSTAETFGMSVLEAVLSGMPVLVTRCGGPEETLADAADRGAVEFVQPHPEPSAVVMGYRRLLKKVPDASWDAIRTALERRYSQQAIARVVLAHLGLGSLPDASASAPRLHTVAIAIESRAAATLQPMLLPLAAAGSSTKMINLSAPDGPQPWVGVLRRTLPDRFSETAVRQAARMWATRRAATVADQVRGIVAAEQPDILLVDQFVSAAVAAIKDELPPTVSVTQPSRLWHLVSTLSAAR